MVSLRARNGLCKSPSGLWIRIWLEVWKFLSLGTRNTTIFLSLPVGTHTLYFFHVACSTTETEVLLPPGCKYVKDGELYDSFFRTSCNLEQCTTGAGPCKDSNRRCCCRAVATEPIDVACDEGSFLSGIGVSTNETHCGCTICDDIEVVVSVLVREPGEGGAIIPGAQVVDKKTGELLGLTYTNGKMTFRTLVEEKFVTVIVVAANYVPRQHKIELVATRSTIEVIVALLPMHPVPVAPEDSGYTFRVSDRVYVTIPADGFQRNGSLYNDLVMFNGVYMNAEDDGFQDMLDSDRFVLNKDYFALSFFTHLSFSTPDGEDLVAQKLNYYLELVAPQYDSFLTIYDYEAEQWVNIGDFRETSTGDTNVVKRQRESVTFVQLNVALSGQLIFHASLTNITCWLQMRTFSDELGTAAQGIIGRVVQTGMNSDDGSDGFTFRFGTNTGSSQSSTDGLVSNAICLPLACDNFTRGTVESLLRINIDSPQTPLDFPDGTFDASELGAPTRLGPFFTFGEVITHTDARPRPFFVSVDACIEQGNNTNADRRTYFSFLAENLARVPNDDQCFVKVRLTECVRNGDNQLIFFNENGIRTVFFLGNESLLDESFSADHFFDNDCNEQSRIVCISFACNTGFQIAVRDHNIVDFCNVSMLSPIAQSEFIMQPSVPQTVQLRTEELALQDYNNPDLGLYYDPNPDVAREICLDPLGLSLAPGDVSIEGYAVTFDCVGESTVDI